MASTFKKHWYFAAGGLTAAALLGLTVLLNTPAPDNEASPDGNDTTQPEPAPEQRHQAPRPSEPKPETPDDKNAPLPDTETPPPAQPAMNAADECIAKVIDDRIIPSYEYMAREFRTALETGLYINPQREVNRIQAIAAREFEKCSARTDAEPTDASNPVRAEMEAAKQAFVNEFNPN